MVPDTAEISITYTKKVASSEASGTSFELDAFELGVYGGLLADPDGRPSLKCLVGVDGPSCFDVAMAVRITEADIERVCAYFSLTKNQVYAAIQYASNYPPQEDPDIKDWVQGSMIEP